MEIIYVQNNVPGNILALLYGFPNICARYYHLPGSVAMSICAAAETNSPGGYYVLLIKLAFPRAARFTITHDPFFP